uniref:Uncharacterized protein n=1 Tax=Glossina pallidipes TaxID=7398 RepID=A0A1A9ZD79_GLOPL
MSLPIDKTFWVDWFLELLRSDMQLVHSNNRGNPVYEKSIQTRDAPDRCSVSRHQWTLVCNLRNYTALHNALKLNIINAPYFFQLSLVGVVCVEFLKCCEHHLIGLKRSSMAVLHGEDILQSQSVCCSCDAKEMHSEKPNISHDANRKIPRNGNHNVYNQHSENGSFTYFKIAPCLVVCQYIVSFQSEWASLSDLDECDTFWCDANLQTIVARPFVTVKL